MDAKCYVTDNILQIVIFTKFCFYVRGCIFSQMLTRCVIVMLQGTRTSTIGYSFAFAALFIATTFAMSQIVHAIFEAKSLTNFEIKLTEFLLSFFRNVSHALNFHPNI